MVFNRRRYQGQTLGNWVGNNLLVEQAKMLSLRLKNENRKKRREWLSFVYTPMAHPPISGSGCWETVHTLDR